MGIITLASFDYTLFVLSLGILLTLYGLIELFIFLFTSPEKTYHSYLGKRIKIAMEEIKKGQVKTFSLGDINRIAKERYVRNERLKKKYYPLWNIYLWAKNLCKYKIPQGLYYVKSLLFYRYNVIKIKTLGPGWTDRDCVMVHAMFQVFCNFIEQEEPFERISWDYGSEINRIKKEKWKNQREKNRYIRSLERGDKRVKKAKKEMQFLYNWWKKTYPELVKKGIDMDKVSAKENEMILRLINIRGYMWT
jgi:hypothetical protein